MLADLERKRTKEKQVWKVAMNIVRNWYHEADIETVLTYGGINLGELIEYHLFGDLIHELAKED